MNLIDTHCHIHFSDYGLGPDQVIKEAREAGVTRMLCVGTTLEDSEAGIDFVESRDGIWTTIGLHPHEAKLYAGHAEKLKKFSSLISRPKVVAVGEAGLDYYYNHSPKEAQRQILEFQLDLARSHDLPVIFHVREAFDDFWPILSNFKGLKGVLHSFTATTQVMEEAIKRDLYIGLNGIMTFTKDENQLKMAKNVPPERLLLETDAPFLTPVPFRGTICEPKHLVLTARFLADLRDVSLEELAEQTSKNSSRLFKI